MYIQNNNLGDYGPSKHKNKLLTKGVTFTKRLDTKEPKYNPYDKRFIRKGKTFQAFNANDVIKLDSLVVSFAKTRSVTEPDKITTTEANTADTRSKVVNIRPFSRKQATDIPLAGSEVKSVAAIHMPVKQDAQKKPKNMHILDIEKEIALSKVQKSQYSVSMASHKHLNRSQGSLKAKISPKEPREYTLEEMKALFAMDVRPFSSAIANTNSENNLLSSGSANLRLDIKKKTPIYSSSRVFSKDSSYLGRVKTADATALRAQLSRDFTVHTKESSNQRLEKSKERTSKSAFRPASGMPTFSKRHLEGSESDLLLPCKDILP